MFGFVRPLRGELKVREWERFQSVYCGLCHTIRRRYGFMQTMMLSYDCTYLALVLDALEPGRRGTMQTAVRHAPVSPPNLCGEQRWDDTCCRCQCDFMLA